MSHAAVTLISTTNTPSPDPTNHGEAPAAGGSKGVCGGKRCSHGQKRRDDPDSSGPNQRSQVACERGSAGVVAKGVAVGGHGGETRGKGARMPQVVTRAKGKVRPRLYGKGVGVKGKGVCRYVIKGVVILCSVGDVARSKPANHPQKGNGKGMWVVGEAPWGSGVEGGVKGKQEVSNVAAMKYKGAT